MMIRGWHVEGFGILDDYRMADLPDGLVVLQGPNEAGKSTLLAFICSVLFGGAGKKAWQLPYPPLRHPTGRHGGRLFLEVPDGVVTVERFAEKGNHFHLRLPGGREGTAEDLQRMVGGADAALFQSVFAFSLAQLQELRSLTDERLRLVVFATGITGAGRSAGQVIQKLEDESRVLLKVSAGRLFDLAADLRKMEDERAQIESRIEAYRSLVEAESALENSIVQLRDRIQERRALKQKYEALLELWPTWCDLRQNSEQLGRLEPVDWFPADAEQRLATLAEKLNAARKAASEIQGEIEIARKRHSELVSLLDERLPAISGKVQSQADQSMLQRDRLNGLVAAKTQVAAEQEKLNQLIAELGPDWNEARLKSFDISLPTREEIRDWEARLGRAAEITRKADQDHAAAEQGRNDAVAQRDRIRTSRDQAPKPDETALADNEQLLTRVKADLQELRTRERKHESLQSSLEDAERALRDSEAPAVMSVPAWMPLASWLAAILLAGAGTWRVVQRDAVGAAVLLLLALGVAAAGFLASRFRQGQRAGQKRRQEAAEQLRSKQQTLAVSVNALSEEIRHLNRDVDDRASKLGFKIVAGFYELEQKERELNRERQLLSDWHTLDRRLNEAEQALVEAQRREALAAEALNQARHNESERWAEWQAWKQERGVAGLGSPSAVIDFFQQVRTAKDQLAVRDQAATRQQQLEDGIAEWEKRSRELSQATGLSPADGSNGEALISAIAGVQKACQQDASRRQELLGIEQSLGNLDSRLRAAEDEERTRKETCRDLLDEAGVDDEKAFREKAEVFKKRAECKRVIQDCEKFLVARLGLGPEAEACRTELAAGNRSLWQETVRNSGAELPGLEEERDKALQECGKVREERLQIEASADLAAKEAEVAARKEEFASAVRQWRVLSLAKGMVEKTLETFTIQRQPAVHTKASHLLTTATDGYYVRITQDEESLIPVVFDRDGREKKPEHLSRGTAELLYLCLRFGLAAEFCRRSGVPVPLVMDDVLVNFDPERAGLMARLLSEYVAMPGAPGQLLLFTCHPETVALVRTASPGCAVIELERFGIPKPRAQAGTTAGT